ncbi:type I-C CRISPR-associated endonuclease Cas1c [Marasmitruncus massiliensis]|uniref:type I-C CRISPR-associated endonuclease Cas1c n=1 Tax=Marasmitruncus massiliensis TaxID=1944642 RepID=UPI000C7E2E84|nr:type I-C CRISPR-associated endonuclease Cas1c [Marasmitruncus massiliensis]
MRKLLNTLYITRPEAYLSLDGENVAMLLDGKEAARLPLSNIESIICMNYPGCSPALMGKCAEEQIGLCFVSPGGRFLARVTGPIKGNVFLRKQQMELFSDPEKRTALIRNLITAKLKNTRSLLMRSRRDYPMTDENGELSRCIDMLEYNQKKLLEEKDENTLRGIEGQSAKEYFNVFDLLFTQQKEDFALLRRTKRPPLDLTNAMLSFLYTICTNDIASALECVGLDPYIGLFHTLRPGRASLACDIMEEFRALVERLVITMVNLKMVQKSDFEKQISGAVWLNDDGRKKVITAWQDKKNECISHPFIKEKMPIGLFPYVQANLLAKYIRSEIEAYPNLIWG